MRKRQMSGLSLTRRLLEAANLARYSQRDWLFVNWRTPDELTKIYRLSMGNLIGVTEN